jgi:hypothetical protein
MRKQIFDKIKKTLTILLAVFFVVTLTAASASACASKVANNNLANKVVGNTDASGLTKDQKTALGNQLLDMADNNWFGNGLGNGCNNGCDNGWGNGWFGNNWGNSCDSCDNGWGNGW